MIESKLKTLSSKLALLGLPLEAGEVNSVIRNFEKIRKVSSEIDWGIKEDAILSDEALQTIVNFFGLEHPNADPKIEKYKDLVSCIDDRYCGLYRNEEFERVALGLASKVVNPLVEAKNDLVGAFGSIDEEDKEILSDIMRVSSSDMNQNAKITINGKNELAPSLTKQAGITEWFNTLVNGDEAKAAFRAAGNKVGFWGRSLPFVGLMFSLPLAIKNTLEAYENGKTILYELPFEKYNISKSDVLNPLNLSSLESSLEEAINSNQDNPENLMELLTMMKTVSAFWLDVIFSITNAVMLIIDVSAILVSFIDGPLPIADALAGGFSLLATAGLIGLEFGSEHASREFWDNRFSHLKEVANGQISNLEFRYPEAIEEATEEAESQEDESDSSSS